MTIERFKLSLGDDTEGYITDKIEHKTYFLRSDDVKKEITGILNQFHNENEDLKTDISVLNRHYDEYENICAKLKKENKELKTLNTHLKNELSWIRDCAYWNRIEAFDKLYTYYMLTVDEYRIMAKENQYLKELLMDCCEVSECEIEDEIERMKSE